MNYLLYFAGLYPVHSFPDKGRSGRPGKTKPEALSLRLFNQLGRHPGRSRFSVFVIVIVIFKEPGQNFAGCLAAIAALAATRLTWLA